MLTLLKKRIECRGGSSTVRLPWQKIHKSRENSEEEEEPELIQLKSPPKGNIDVVLYYTSTRIIRKTYAECSAVMGILRSLNIPFQERDLFVTRKYVEELKEIFGERVLLPQLFVRGKYVGGCERIMDLHECGKLQKMVADYVNKRPMRECRGCGDMRYKICFVCNGSKRLYEEERNVVVNCVVCNENGLVACPNCSLGGVELRRLRGKDYGHSTLF